MSAPGITIFQAPVKREDMERILSEECWTINFETQKNKFLILTIDYKFRNTLYCTSQRRKQVRTDWCLCLDPSH